MQHVKHHRACSETKTSFFKMSPDTSDGAQTRQGYFLYQKYLPLPWRLADHHEAIWDLGSSCMNTGQHRETIPAIFSPTRNHPASPQMGSWVMLRAGKVPVVFLSGCTPWPWPKRKHVEPCRCGATWFPDLSWSHLFPRIRAEQSSLVKHSRPGFTACRRHQCCSTVPTQPPSSAFLSCRWHQTTAIPAIWLDHARAACHVVAWMSNVSTTPVPQVTWARGPQVLDHDN